MLSPQAHIDILQANVYIINPLSSVKRLSENIILLYDTNNTVGMVVFWGKVPEK